MRIPFHVDGLQVSFWVVFCVCARKKQAHLSMETLFGSNGNDAEPLDRVPGTEPYDGLTRSCLPLVASCS